MTTKEKYSNFRGVRKIEILEIEVNEGSGEIEDPMYREVFYCTMDGKIIGHESNYPLRKFAGE